MKFGVLVIISLICQISISTENFAFFEEGASKIRNALGNVEGDESSSNCSFNFNSMFYSKEDKIIEEFFSSFNKTLEKIDKAIKSG